MIKRLKSEEFHAWLDAHPPPNTLGLNGNDEIYCVGPLPSGRWQCVLSIDVRRGKDHKGPVAIAEAASREEALKELRGHNSKP